MISKDKEKKCKTCKETFSPATSLQQVCSMQCAIQLSQKKRKLQEEKQAKENRKVMKERKKRLMTMSEKKKKLQEIFNKWIKIRDKGDPCISCGKSMENKTIHAGHFYSVGRFPELRFNPDNVHAQCSWCNVFLHGNGALYRINLEKKIGKERLEKLDRLAGVSNPYLPHEIEDLTVMYQNKVKKT